MNKLEQQIKERLRYCGVLSLLAKCSVHVPEDLREMIEVAMEDACGDGSMKWKRILNSIEIEPVFRTRCL